MKRITINDKVIDFEERTYIMGILNATPDSFSDGGKYNDVDAAVQRAKELQSQGADILDIGGESTRPGAETVDVKEEISRTIPVIEAITEEIDIPISIDTYKSETAKQALEAGAAIINDIWGAKKDPDMAYVACEYDVPIVLMHNRNNTDYKDLLAEIKEELEESIDICTSAGVKQEHIIIDPGIGFGKTYEQNLEVMRRLDEITDMGYPVLLGTSRKSMIAKTLNLPVEERIEGTGATVALGITHGCHIVRVHDVLEMKRVAKMMDAMLGKGKVTSVG